MKCDNERCCGTCQWHRYEPNHGWVCCNDQSIYFADWTEYKDSCQEWEAR